MFIHATYTCSLDYYYSVLRVVPIFNNKNIITMAFSVAGLARAL